MSNTQQPTLTHSHKHTQLSALTANFGYDQIGIPQLDIIHTMLQSRYFLIPNDGIVSVFVLRIHTHHRVGTVIVLQQQ